MWVEDSSQSGGYSTPYKFTGKELDTETGLYYFGARYYDARMGRWLCTDPALEEGRYFPKPNDYDTEHDFYWYLSQDGSRKLPGLGGVFNAVNLDVYHYAGNNPVMLVDPDGYQTVDPEIFKQLIMSDPLIQLVKGLFEGDAAAKYAVKMGMIEVGIKAGNVMNDIGTGMIIFGAMDGNPAMIIIGGTVDTAGDITRLSFIIIKAIDTKSEEDMNDAIKEGVYTGASLIIGNISKQITSCGLKNQFNSLLKIIFGKEGKITNIDKKAGEKIIEKVAGDSAKIIIKGVYKKE